MVMFNKRSIASRFVPVVFLIASLVGCGATKQAPVSSHKAPNTVRLRTSSRVRGIYVNSSTSLNRKKLTSLVANAKAAGINTFVMDYVSGSPRFRRAVKWVEGQGIQYVPRVVMYPDGATMRQVRSQAYFDSRMRRILAAASLGAHDVQLDYIRFKHTQRRSLQNADLIANIINRIADRLDREGVGVQIDIFGIAAHGPSHNIGQDVSKMAPHVDAICPMVYPSHYRPYIYHSQRPYQTILDSVRALQKQLRGHKNVRVYPYIEAYNFRYRMNRSQKVNYIRKELAAVRDSGAEGWFVWSARNHYGNLFRALVAR